MVIYFRMDQQLTIDLVGKHAAACKEQLSVESCDTDIKFYDQQKGKNASPLSYKLLDVIVTQVFQ